MEKGTSCLAKAWHYISLAAFMAAVSVLAFFDASYGKDFFLKMLISAVSIIAIAAIGRVIWKHGWKFFDKFAIPSVFSWLSGRQYLADKKIVEISGTPPRSDS